jgi:hypothetical protein
MGSAAGTLPPACGGLFLFLSFVSPRLTPWGYCLSPPCGAVLIEPGKAMTSVTGRAKLTRPGRECRRAGARWTPTQRFSPRGRRMNFGGAPRVRIP